MRARITVLAATCTLFFAGCGGPPSDVGAAPPAAAVASNEEDLASAAPIAAEYAGFEGREFEFRAKHGTLARFGYSNWRVSTEVGAEAIPYDEFAGTRAKLAPFPVKGADGGTWYAALTPSGRTVFGEARDGRSPPSGISFADDVAKAKALVGGTVWLRPDPKARSLGRHITSERDVTVPRKHLEPLAIVRVETGMYGHAPAGLLHLVARTEDGTEVLLPYRPGSFLSEDPIDASWGDDVRRLIRSQTVRRGMTSAQIRLAWGEPARVRKLDEGKERWEFATGEHVDLAEGVMVGGKAGR